MVLSGDDVSELSDRNLELLRRLTPPTDVAAIFDDNSWTIGRAKIDEMKTMIYIFNLKDEARDIEVPLDSIYHVYDILSETDLGICEGSLRMLAFRAHYAVALRLERCYPIA
jgi:alpha-galactosidase